jgi:ribonuclease J
MGTPDIVSRGFVFVKESDELISKIKNITYKEVKRCNEKSVCEWKDIKSAVKDGISKYVYNKTKRNPMILPIIVTV